MLIYGKHKWKIVESSLLYRIHLEFIPIIV